MRQALFYRFAAARQEAGALDAGDADEIVESVIREVTTLLNSRAPLSASACEGLSRRTVLDYGLPDFVHLSPLGRQDAQALAMLIQEAIKAHEPRLRLRDVTVETPRPCRDVVYASISGQVIGADQVLSPVQFRVRVAATALNVH